MTKGDVIHWMRITILLLLLGETGSQYGGQPVQPVANPGYGSQPVPAPAPAPAYGPAPVPVAKPSYGALQPVPQPASGYGQPTAVVSNMLCTSCSLEALAGMPNIPVMPAGVPGAAMQFVMPQSGQLCTTCNVQPFGSNYPSSYAAPAQPSPAKSSYGGPPVPPVPVPSSSYGAAPVPVPQPSNAYASLPSQGFQPQPVGPVAPIQPVGPIAPVQPVGPVAPVQPVQPVVPTQPPVPTIGPVAPTAPTVPPVAPTVPPTVPPLTGPPVPTLAQTVIPPTIPSVTLIPTQIPPVPTAVNPGALIPGSGPAPLNPVVPVSGNVIPNTVPVIGGRRALIKNAQSDVGSHLPKPNGRGKGFPPSKFKESSESSEDEISQPFRLLDDIKDDDDYNPAAIIPRARFASHIKQARRRRS